MSPEVSPSPPNDFDPGGTVNKTLPVKVYSAESPIAHPGLLIREITSDIWMCRSLIWVLFRRDLMAQYRQSYFGYIWIFAPILATVVTWTFITSQEIVQIADTDIPYPAFILVGTIIWTAFTSCLTQPLASFNAGSAVFMKLRVAPEAFILAGVGKVTFDIGTRLIVLIPVFLTLGIWPVATAPLFLAGIGVSMLLGLAVGMCLLPIGSLYGDVTRVVSMVVGLGMYLTPIVYPVPGDGIAKTIIEWNPMTYVVLASREWLTRGPSEHSLAVFVIAIAAIVILTFGITLLRITLPHLIERMGM